MLSREWLPWRSSERKTSNHLIRGQSTTTKNLLSLIVDSIWNSPLMNAAVYVKMDAAEELQLSEGVCRQLCIVSYHSGVEPGNVSSNLIQTIETEAVDAVSGNSHKDDTCVVPTVRVRLVNPVRIPSDHVAIVEVKVEESDPGESNLPLLFEANPDLQDSSVSISDCIL